MRLIVLLLIFCCESLIASEAPRIIASGPWDDAYPADQAMRRRTWIRFSSPAIAQLKPEERLKFFLQWASTADGPWKTRSKGEIELRTQRLYTKTLEHPRFKTRGYLQKDLNNDTDMTFEVGPLAASRWEEDGIPYFRISESDTIHSTPFQAKLDVVYSYFPTADKKNHPPRAFTTTKIFAGERGPWSTPSFAHGPLPYVAFFIALGGTNNGCVIPSQPFVAEGGPSEKMEFWSCHDKPAGFRDLAIPGTDPDTLWWGVCPVRVPLPPVGESTVVTITSHFGNEEYSKAFTIYGHQRTEERLAERRLIDSRFKQLLGRLGSPPEPTNKSADEISREELAALMEYEKAQKLHKLLGAEHAGALADAYIALLNIEEEAWWHQRSKTPATEAEKLHDILQAAGLAEQLQDWGLMRGLLDTYLSQLTKAFKAHRLSAKDFTHFCQEPILIHPRTPFDGVEISASFLQLLKSWAWTIGSPDVYQQALDIKKALVHPSDVRSSEDLITPQEYRELAQLTMERTGHKDKAEEYWRKADSLILDMDSPFHNSAANKKQLRMMRPGWAG